MNLSGNFKELFENFDFSFLLNNIGDPITTYSGSDRFYFEKKVIEFFADLYSLNREEMRGYVTTGGSEGNFYGLYLGRESYPDAVALFSMASHYSIPKYSKMLRIPYEIISTLDTGEINYLDLEKKIIQNKDKPIILSLNIGTTMAGAIDNVDTVILLLTKHKINDYYIHCDAALFGGMLPFLSSKNRISFSDNIGSLSISGHKFFGTPTPCGVVLTRQKYVDKISSVPGYTGAEDSTILGSRSGHAPILLWYAIASIGKAQIKKTVRNCIGLARYLHSSLQSLGFEPLLNPDSNIVLFNKPNDQIVNKWKLASVGNKSHVVVMPHVSKEMIDQFLSELKQA